jgi:translation elongation factor EF-Tu-like GTPase
MQTVVVDIVNEKTMALLVDMETMDLIHVHDNKSQSKQTCPISELKGKITKQPIEEVNKQLSELRNAWE